MQQFQFQTSERGESSSLPNPADAAGDDDADDPARDDGANEEKKLSSELPNGSVVTPATRLAWQDLMGGEDAEHQHNHNSPDEQLQWEDEMIADASPLVPRRGKKRARSSSPVSSPALDKTKASAVNVKRLKQALDTTRADPALDLWDRFAVGAPDSKNALSAANPALAHLMVSSSPRPSKNSVPIPGEAGLRRAISCGSLWPKRRRVESTIAPNPARERTKTSKTSMVTALLETVNSEINKSDEMEEEDSGMASPSIKMRRPPAKPAASPTPAAPPNILESEISAPRRDPEVEQDAQGGNTPSSDYGDDDFDDDTMLELNASLLSGQVEAGSFTAAEHAIATGTVKNQGQTHDTSFVDEFEDEFDDLDDDVLAAAERDMFKVALPEQASKAAPTTTTNAVHLDGGTNDSDDTYEDEFGGDFDFEAVELAATQSVSQKASSLMPVRTT